MAKGRLSKTEKHYIASNPYNLSIEDMASELGRTVKTVQKYYTVEEAPKVQKSEKKGPMKTRVNGAFARPKDKKGIVMATAQSSELADKSKGIDPFRQEQANVQGVPSEKPKISPRYKDCIAPAYQGD